MRTERRGETSAVRAMAAALLGRRPMSRRDLVRKLTEKGASPEEAGNAAEWLASLGALNDAEYAALLVRHCAGRGYGPARIREKLYEKGVPRELWEEALAAAPEQDGQIDAFLAAKLRGRTPDRREKQRLTAALERRGFSWEDIRSAWERYGALEPIF